MVENYSICEWVDGSIQEGKVVLGEWSLSLWALCSSPRNERLFYSSGNLSNLRTHLLAVVQLWVDMYRHVMCSNLGPSIAISYQESKTHVQKYLILGITSGHRSFQNFPGISCEFITLLLMSSVKVLLESGKGDMVLNKSYMVMSEIDFEWVMAWRLTGYFQFCVWRHEVMENIFSMEQRACDALRVLDTFAPSVSEDLVHTKQSNSTIGIIRLRQLCSRINIHATSHFSWRIAHLPYLGTICYP